MNADSSRRRSRRQRNGDPALDSRATSGVNGLFPVCGHLRQSAVEKSQIKTPRIKQFEALASIRVFRDER